MTLIAGCFAAWHVFLVVTAQTSIEYYGNRVKRAWTQGRARPYRNAYSLGARLNWAHTCGDGRAVGCLSLVRSLLPSLQARAWPPYPCPRMLQLQAASREGVLVGRQPARGANRWGAAPGCWPQPPPPPPPQTYIQKDVEHIV